MRALAIALVVMHHIGQNLESLPPVFLHYFSLGTYGVDLFFVLSGWLIGGLYWNEFEKFGNVQLGRFWARRWLRTLPPYFLALPLAYLSVYLFRQQEFDFAYLFFLQNYKEHMPFYLISWSLAVEEHFYLLLPLVLGLFILLKLPLVAILALLVLLAAAARLFDPSAMPGAAFGYSKTASHFHFTGLLLGVLLAYLSRFKTAIWVRLTRFSKSATVAGVVLYLTIPFWSSETRYYFGNTLAIFAFASLLVAAHSGGHFLFAGRTWVRNLALCSYSVYLTHSMVLNAGLLLADKIGLNYLLAVPVWLVAIVATGWCFYLFAERSSIVLRDQLVQRRPLVAV